jgi:hypothetical protein
LEEAWLPEIHISRTLFLERSLPEIASAKPTEVVGGDTIIIKNKIMEEKKEERSKY